MRKLILFINRIFAKLNIFSKKVYYVGGNDSLPPPLKKDEEEELVQELINGKEGVRDILIERNLRLVVYIARKFENTGVGVEDLISVGTIGLIKAVNTFNPEKKIKLATYASRCIENEILMYLRRNSKIKAEVSFYEPLNIDWDGNELLLSDILGTDNDTVYNLIEDEVDKQLLFLALKNLNEREKEIVRLRFGLNGKREKTQKEVADMLGISQSYISRLEKKIISRLKKEIYAGNNFKCSMLLLHKELMILIINKVEICGVNTSKLPVIKEKKELIIKMREGDKKARETFIQGNLRLVLSVIQRFNNRGENVDDLFQVGCIGLMKAIDNFDLEQNVKFSTYAVPMIIGEIRRYLRDNNAIRVSRSLRDIAYKALLVRDRLVKDNNQEPTMSQIAKELNIPREEVVFALDAIQDPVSLFEPIYHDGGDAIYVMDQISDSKNSDDSWLENISIREAMKKLNNREKLILTLRFFNGKTQMEVADEIGISQAQVSRLEKTALKHMRKYV